MYAKAKSLLPFLSARGAAENVKSKKPAVKSAVSSQHKKRNELIDQVCATWGTDLNTLRRYFALSRTV